MNVLQRAFRICTQPAAEWRVIEAERTRPAQAIFGYLLPLTLMTLAVSLVRMAMFAEPLRDPSLDVGVMTLASVAAFGIIATLGACAITAFVINGVAPTFQARPGLHQAFKLAVYSWTPVVLAGLLRIVPVLGELGILSLIGALYALYLLYLGLPVLMKSPSDRTVPYVLVVAVVAFVATMAVSMTIGMLLITGSLFTDNPFRIV